MASSPSLTFENVLYHARVQKGLDIITLIDGVCQGVLREVQSYMADGRLIPLAGGGLMDERGLCVLLGAEVEVSGPTGGAAHFGCWFKSVEAALDFSEWLKTVQRNVYLSSQRARTDAATLAGEVHARDGMFIVHHAFTPHKGLYGNCVDSMVDMLNPSMVDAVELGLSADTEMADCVAELYDMSFISNSDAHSLPKIAREYNALSLAEPSFEEVRAAFHREQGRMITGNFGLMPALGKYHRTYCLDCGQHWQVGASSCKCGSRRAVIGVYDRLLQFRDTDTPNSPLFRPAYTHQIPLEFIPGLGPKLREKLLSTFANEMTILHQTSVESLAKIIGEPLAARIDLARRGKLSVIEGGGGAYGRIMAREVNV